MKMLNCGFERGKPVIRCDKDHPDQITTHDVYGPKVMSSRQTFQDKALEARCITETMEETSRQLPSSLNEKFFDKRQELRNKLLMFRFRNLVPLQERLKREAPPTGLEHLPIEPRLKQVGTPFAIIFHDKPDILKEFFNWIKENQRKLVEERATSLEGEIVEVIYESEQNNIDPDYLFVTAKNITDKLNEGRAKPLNSGTVGRIMKSLGFENVLGRDDDGKVTRKVKRQPARLQKLYKRYVPNFITQAFSSIDKISQFSEVVTPVTVVTDVTSSDDYKTQHECIDIAKRGGEDKVRLPVTSVTSVTSVTKKQPNVILEDGTLVPEDLGEL